MTTSSLKTSTIGYYGWVVVGTAFVIVMLSAGVRISFGNFLKPMSAEVTRLVVQSASIRPANSMT
jgi:hypothetical protein